MDTPNRLPYMSREAVIERLEQWASKTNMTQEEALYEKEWKAYNDFINTLDFAEQEGRQEALMQIACKLKEMGMTNEFIAEVTELSKEEMEKL